MVLLQGEIEFVFLHLLTESEGFFREVEAFFGHVLAKGVHFEFVLEFLMVEFETLFADLNASGEIGEALQREELSGGVFAGGRHLIGGFHDGVVGFLRGRLIAGENGVEFGDGKFFAGLEVGVDFGDLIGFAVKGLERADRDCEAESLGAWFVNSLPDLFVFLVAKPVGDLVDFLFGEGGEGALFSHKS